jgi:hypothetical protein
MRATLSEPETYEQTSHFMLTEHITFCRGLIDRKLINFQVEHEPYWQSKVRLHVSAELTVASSGLFIQDKQQGNAVTCQPYVDMVKC